MRHCGSRRLLLIDNSERSHTQRRVAQEGAERALISASASWWRCRANGLRRCWSRSLGSERDQSAGSEAEGLTRDLRRKADEQPGRLAHTILW